ncbi:hypothetical protein SH1V18_41550 [Vallitalea longa]|uniref:Uncharacterized protein n=1 Tax=Vallitalea longa TaxID=2936439 RepID=A0A9W5YCR6_9FIRM|nr:hypothetical protein [Vallitalea longa]GKX31675.1 hypothetical protein SH1V18_41550 [Vallitalea longa]
MDINCTHNCIYQKDGKCNLSVSVTLNNISNNKNINIDCPYYISKEEDFLDNYSKNT